MRRHPAAVGLLAAGLLFLAGCAEDTAASEQTATEDQQEPAVTENELVIYDVVVVNSYPHDEGAYTQGLEFVDGQLLESTGRIGSSSIRLVDPESGTVVEQQPLAGELYGEGATVAGNEVWQLTYQSETVIVRSLDGLAEDRRYDYDGEGWGLCFTGSQLLMSDGTDELVVRELESFTEVGVIPVTLNGEPVERLNELECVEGLVWANVYQTNEILAISGTTGRVAGIADLSQLVPEGFEDSNELVLNGIAYNSDTGRFWVTGKQWPVMYEIELTAASEN